MVKKKAGGGKRLKAVETAKAQGKAQPEWQGPAPPLRIQKKLTRKVQFLEKVSKAASVKTGTKSGGVGKKTARKRALPDLATLTSVLEEVAREAGDSAGKAAVGAKQRGEAVNSAKQRQHILAEESQRMKAVLQHPAYRADPIAAITNHLQHTLPPPPAAKKVPAKADGRAKKAGAGKGKGKSAQDAMAE